MRTKALTEIKHGQRVVDSLESGQLFFVADIKKATGLDDKTLRTVLNNLLRHQFLHNNGRGQWFLPT